MAWKPNLKCHLFLTSCGLKLVYAFFNLKKIQRSIFHDTWRLHEIYISVSIDKVLLGYRHVYMFTCCLWLLLCIELSSCVTDLMWCYPCFTPTLATVNHTVNSYKLTVFQVPYVSRYLWYFFLCVPIMSKPEKWTSNIMLLRHSAEWIILIKLDGKALCLLYSNII